MSDLAEQESAVPPLLRDRSGVQRVTNIELFFDLVYVFAVTQLSHYLIGHSTVAGALQTGLLLAMVWLVWSYTTWVTNWLDPEQMAVRLLLVVLMLVSLAMSASLPRAFEDLGLWVGGAYALQQIGRTGVRFPAILNNATDSTHDGPPICAFTRTCATSRRTTTRSSSTGGAGPWFCCASWTYPLVNQGIAAESLRIEQGCLTDVPRHLVVFRVVLVISW